MELKRKKNAMLSSMKTDRPKTSWLQQVTVGVLLVILAGCATPKNAGPKYAFFPPAPDAPHLQFLTAFASERDLRGGGASLMAFITGEPPSERPILKPYGGAVRDRKIYVCDTGAGFLMKLDLTAKRLFAIAPSGPGAFKLPLNVAIDDNGLMYVVDSLRDQVVILDTNENFVATLCDRGVNKPRDVAVSANHIYVGDIETHRVHVFDKATRALQFDIPRGPDATNMDRALFQPSNITLDTQGRLYGSDLGGFRVQVFDGEGKYLRTIGKYGDNYGEFARPKGVAVDRAGRTYVVDAAGQMVQIFDDKGQLLMWFGEPSGSKVGLSLPTKVIIDYDDVDLFKSYAAPDFEVEHLVIVINQFGPRKVSIFGFGHKK